MSYADAMNPIRMSWDHLEVRSDIESFPALLVTNPSKHDDNHYSMVSNLPLIETARISLGSAITLTSILAVSDRRPRLCQAFTMFSSSRIPRAALSCFALYCPRIGPTVPLTVYSLCLTCSQQHCPHLQVAGVPELNGRTCVIFSIFSSFRFFFFSSFRFFFFLRFSAAVNSLGSFSALESNPSARRIARCYGRLNSVRLR